MTIRKGKDKTFLFPIYGRGGEMEMTKEERKKLADFFNDNYARFLTEEDEAKRACYRGKAMGVDFALDALGYTIKGDGVEVRFFPDSGKFIECAHHKVVKKPRKRN